MCYLGLCARATRQHAITHSTPSPKSDPIIGHLVTCSLNTRRQHTRHGVISMAVLSRSRCRGRFYYTKHR
ncbi:hypothetical protein RSAG8_08418, partial [Rhizoctonia solani AG-8 WAC10335]